MQINTSSQQPQLPPGFRFHPTDEELVVHYLQKKESNDPLPVAIIAEVDLYKHDPWELPAMATFGEHEWYFFSMREKKYPNGGRPNRTATSGYWKATGTDKPVLTAGGTQKIGVKKALVFYGGKPPKGVKTNWIMHEYRLITGRGSGSSKPPVVDDTAKNKTSLRLDDWVLCRIYKKSNTQRAVEVDGGGDVVMAMNGGILASQPPCRLFNNNNNNQQQQQQGFMNHEQNNVLFDNMLNSKSSGNELLPSTACTKMFLMDTSSMAATQHTGNNHEYQLPDMNNWYSN